MEPGPEVLDISSDEEDATFFKKLTAPSSDVFSELLGGPAKVYFDSDDVLVVDELSCPAVRPHHCQPTLYNDNSALMANSEVIYSDDDDDCLVLDGDPDKPVAVVQDKGDGSDELLIVSEKGQLACRDYPHPRHLCATFPFQCTSHEKFCAQCHCYVCDSVAPCAYWGDGASGVDHCHSTDKEEKWKLLRKSWKQPFSTMHSVEATGNTPCVQPTFSCPTPIPNFVAHPVSQSLLSQTLRVCSANNLHNPIQKQLQQSGILHGRQGFSQLQRSIQLSSLANHDQPYSEFPHFKRTGSARGALMGSRLIRSRQGFASHIRINRTVPQRARRSCIPVPQKNQYPPLLVFQGNQCAPEIPTSDAASNRFKDILAGLESELGISRDSNNGASESQSCTRQSSAGENTETSNRFTSNWRTNLPEISVHTCANNILLPTQVDSHYSTDVAEACSANLKNSLDSSNLDGSLLCRASNGLLQGIVAESPVALHTAALGDASIACWTSFAEQECSLEAPKNPNLPFNDASFFFDFEDPWTNL